MEMEEWESRDLLALFRCWIDMLEMLLYTGANKEAHRALLMMQSELSTGPQIEKMYDEQMRILKQHP